MIFNGVFILSNVLPGCIFYFPFTLLAAALVRAALLLFLSASSWLVSSKHKEATINMIPMVSIPLALVMDSAMQWLAGASVYLYQGVGYFEAAWLVTSERQSSIYCANCLAQVVGKATWLMELVNEAAP